MWTHLIYLSNTTYVNSSTCCVAIRKYQNALLLVRRVERSGQLCCPWKECWENGVPECQAEFFTNMYSFKCISSVMFFPPLFINVCKSNLFFIFYIKKKRWAMVSWKLCFGEKRNKIMEEWSNFLLNSSLTCFLIRFLVSKVCVSVIIDIQNNTKGVGGKQFS